MSKKQTYIVDESGWIAGLPREKGEELELTAEQAKYENVTLKAQPSKRAAKAQEK